MNRSLFSPASCAAVLSALAAVSACASSQAPRELVDARAAYARVSTSQTATLEPAAVKDAKTTLDAAERSFADSDDAYIVRDKAYIATRKVELAEVLAQTQRAKQQEAQAMQLVHAQREAMARAQNSELAQARSQLSTTEQRLSQANENLTAERQAREESEKKTREAIDKLAATNALAVKDEARGTVITMGSGVLFATGKSDLLPGATAKLAAVADALTRLPGHKIIIEGHTDSQGSDASNMQLSERRAETVRNFFASHGVAQDQMTATGIGESRPISDNATADGRAANRRVEIILPSD